MPTPCGAVRSPPVLYVGGDTLIGDDEVTDLDPDAKGLLKGDPSGRCAFYAAPACGWWAPLRPLRRVAAAPSWPCSTRPSEFAERGARVDRAGVPRSRRAGTRASTG